ncbi:MAG: oligosaccharide repeat unit polymerase [Paludibacteraceae bacterium]|nr:oligosaccharide repeat unit polymerase [Paludibacteraceae bacterium]
MEVTLFVILFLLVTMAWFGYRWYAEGAFTQPLTGGGWFAPWTIHLLHWGIVSLLIALSADSLFPTTPRLWESLAIWIPVLFLASFFAYWPCSASEQVSDPQPGKYGKMVFYGILVLSCIITPLYLRAVWHNVSEFRSEGTGELVRDLRNLCLEEKDYGVLGWAFVLNKLLFVVSFYWRRHLPWWIVPIVVILNVFTAASVMEKGYLVFMVVIATWLLYEQGVLKMWHIGVTIAVALIGAYFFTLIRTFADVDSQDRMSFMDFFSIYVTSSSVAYCYMPDDTLPQWGGETFTRFYHILNRLGVGSYAEAERVQQFIHVPIETNTYTVMQPFYLDFGYKGLAFFAYVYGVLCGFLYRWHKQGSAWATCVYAMVLAALCTQFHQEELFGCLIVNIQYAILALFIAL